MEQKISYGICDLSLALFRAEESEADLIELVLEDTERMIQNDYMRFFSALESGRIDSFHYESGGNLYLFTRSARANVLIQKTCFWNRGGELVPLSHVNINSFADMVADGLPDMVTLKAA